MQKKSPIFLNILKGRVAAPKPTGMPSRRPAARTGLPINQLLRIEEQLGQSAEFLGIESINYSE